MPVTRGPIFENQAILPGWPFRAIANLKNKSCGVPVHELRTTVPQMCQERVLYVVAFADVDPFARIRNSINPRRCRRKGLDV